MIHFPGGASPLETKFCGFDGELALKEGAEIAGYASLFGAIDQGGDVVQAGAYGGSLARLARVGSGVKMLWQHDPTKPIGVWDEVREDAKGLYVRGRLLLEVQAAREAVAAGSGCPRVVAVTLLTSLGATDLAQLGIAGSAPDTVLRLAKMARHCGLDGVVASPQETQGIRGACGPEFVIVTPGIRGGSAAATADDQQRTLTPAGAVQAGSSYLDIGRPITAAVDPRAAAATIADEIATAQP